MRVNLHELATGVGHSSEEVDSSSREISQGSLDLSTRTEETANKLQITLAAIAQLSASLNETTVDARSA